MESGSAIGSHGFRQLSIRNVLNIMNIIYFLHDNVSVKIICLFIYSVVFNIKLYY